ncbi:MAG: M28 family metallopeptidase [Acidobacteria bacterium]|nr:M28 family metallopeptidase [Acidobacteriota bacterium]MCL5286948.1 M28 family metallopeptidase [Acidobacteriota bacterium]
MTSKGQEKFEKTGPMEIAKAPAASPGINKNIAGICVCVVVLAAAWAAISMSGPPAAIPASAPEAEFSAERAMTHVKEITREPHPLGSEAHDRVRGYLMSEVKKLGLEPQVQTTTGVTSRWYAAAGTVENLVARLPGSEKGGKALALVSHYDSVAAAPGAGDDGAAVGAMLETLRALKAGPALKHDVIFLFTDGEEGGLLGASAFMDEHPWAKEIGAVLNFEGRGKSGASLMFETSPGNAWLVDAFAKTPHPRGSSLAFEIYKRLPNDTDFTVFKKHGAQGMNFAFVDDWYAYHTPHDSADRLNQGSLQHHGEYMVSLAQQLGNAEFPDNPSGDTVYFNVLGNSLVHYSTGMGIVLALVAAGLYGFVLRRELRQKRTILLGVIWGAGIFVLSLVLTLLTGALVEWKASFLNGRLLPEGDIIRGGAYMLSLVTWVVALNTVMYSLWRNKLGAAGLALGGLLVWTLLALWSAFTVPGASYLLTWPLLGSLIAVAMFRSTGAEESAGRKEIAALLIGALPCVLLFAPTVQQLFVTLGLTRLGTQAICIFLTLALWALIPQIELMTRLRRWLLPGAAWVLCVLFFIGGMFTTRYSAGHPKTDSMVYGRNADTGIAVWFSPGEKPDAWTKQFLSEQPTRETMEDFFPGGAGTMFLKTNAKDVPLAGADVLLGEEKKEGEGRTLTLLVMSPRKAPWITVYVSEAEVLEASVNGKPIAIDPDARRLPAQGWRLRYSHPPEQGIEMMLKVRGTQPVKVRVVDGSWGLPAIPGKEVTPRPDWLMPVHSGDVTLVSRAYKF